MSGNGISIADSPCRKSACNSAAPRRSPPRLTRRCSTACRNPHADTNYVARFTFPNSPRCARSPGNRFRHAGHRLCSQAWLVESKSLKLYLNSFRNHGAFHEDCTVAIGKKLVGAAQAEMAAHRRLFPSARRHADRRVLAERESCRRRMDARSGRRHLPRSLDSDNASVRPLPARHAAIAAILGPYPACRRCLKGRASERITDDGGNQWSRLRSSVWIETPTIFPRPFPRGRQRQSWRRQADARRHRHVRQGPVERGLAVQHQSRGAIADPCNEKCPAAACNPTADGLTAAESAERAGGLS